MKSRWKNFIPSYRTINGRTKKMFGYPVVFISDDMFMGMHNKHIVVRAGERFRNNFIKEKKAKISEPMPGRQMKECIMVPEAVLKSAVEPERLVNASLQ